MPKHDAPKSTSEVRTVTDDSGAKPKSPAEQPNWSSWVAPIALVFALVAVALAAWALLQPADASTTTAPDPEPAAFTDQQIADANARACTAFNIVRNAVSLQTNADPGSDDVALNAAAANARLSLAAGGIYLRSHVDPATPAPLAESIRVFADQLEDTAMNQLAGVPNDDPAQAARMSEAGASMPRIADLCP